MYITYKVYVLEGHSNLERLYGEYENKASAVKRAKALMKEGKNVSIYKDTDTGGVDEFVRNW